MGDILEYEIIFTDITLNEANGEYGSVVDLMQKEYGTNKATAGTIAKSSWVLRSEVGINNEFGYNEMTCQFHADGRVAILEYIPIMRDMFYNIDIRCFAHWCAEKGWKKPEPSYVVIEEGVDFWKHQWLTHIVDSVYFEKRLGKRYDEDIDFENTSDVLNDEIDE